ncbi:FAD binding domain-containing protein [Patulibacter sp. NPDC049589]|uniref:FAD binding domain-containing protein n=1 Tax=Patulibacter sp. NPDC049589 TaxID=3154731 RepID=UPI00341D80C7
MDLETVVDVALPRTRGELPDPLAGDAFLAGGTWMFSVPQTGVRRLVDLTTLGWPALTVSADGLEIAATCTFAELVAFAGGDPRATEDTRCRWPALSLLRPCCDALRGSFKVQHAATVGGNLCLALPAAPMAALATALDGVCVVWTPEGGERHVPAASFVLGERETVLRPGEVLRSVVLPGSALAARTAFRQESLAPLGRSAALLVARADADGAFVLTITASTPAPVVVRLRGVPSRHELAAALHAAVPAAGYHDDVHGDPAWRAQLTALMAEELRAELAGPAAR